MKESNPDAKCMTSIPLMYLLIVSCCYTCDLNTCEKLQLLLGESSSAFLEGKFEPFSRYLAMGGHLAVRNSLIVLAYPYSA